MDFVGVNNNIIFCDLFGGSGVVSKHFKEKGYNIISNDIEYYSYVILRHYIENNNTLSFEKLGYNPFLYLNNLEGIKGFIYNNYSLGGTKGNKYERQYFSDDNACKIDAIRKKIKDWYNMGRITKEEYYYLLASLIESSDKVANTASIYESFLKKLKATAKEKFKLLPLEMVIYQGNRTYRVYNCDANILINSIKGDVLYLDPPYNFRKYDTNYHILETIALDDNPSIKGKSGIRCELTKRSKYCSRKHAYFALEEVICKAKFKYVLLSYNDEGIISTKDIKSIMSKYGKYKCYSRKHKRFKADSNRKYSRNYTTEYIHCLEKNNF